MDTLTEDTMEQMLSMLLAGAVETLDIAPHLQRLAIERYEEVGTWLAEHHGYRCRIYPQGSFRLGTVVRPDTSTGEYDIDLVCCLLIAKETITQAGLKQHVGDLLEAYLQWKDRHGHTDGPKTCQARRRCWTLGYPDHGFHLDVLPTIPDIDHPPTGILLTDKQLYRWQHSNPLGYATWFRSRSEELQRRLTEAALKRHANVADVPEWEVRSTLQRVVQVLKWHCMRRFATDPDNRPPSILITTLAAHAYQGQLGVADKWNDYPERRAAFIAWHKDISTVLDDLVQLQGKGLQVVASRMSESFGPEAVRRSAQRYGEQLRQQRTTGALRMTGTGLLTTTAPGPRVRTHAFHGHHTNPRD